MTDKKPTVDIDIEDLVKLISKADAHDELVDQHRITPEMVRNILSEESFDLENYVVINSDEQQDE